MSRLTIYDDPRWAEAVRYYTDPLLPTFGVKSAAAAAAGIGPGVFDNEAVKKAIAQVIEERQLASRDVIAYLGTYTMDAARELINQLSVGRELEFRADEFDDAVRDQDDKIAMALARHNKIVLDAASERRAAAIEIIRQQIGTPEQRIRVTKDNSPTPLADLSDDKLEELGLVVRETLEQRKVTEIPEAEVEILD